MALQRTPSTGAGTAPLSPCSGLFRRLRTVRYALKLKPKAGRSYSLSGIARAVGVNRSTVSRWHKSAWFPARGADGAYSMRQVIDAARKAGKLRVPAFAAPRPEHGAPTPSPARVLPGGLLTPAPAVIVPEVSYIQAIPARVGEIPAAPGRAPSDPSANSTARCPVCGHQVNAYGGQLCRHGVEIDGVVYDCRGSQVPA